MTQSRNSYMEAELMVPPLDELCKAHEEEVEDDEVEDDEEGSYHTHLEGLVQSLLEEARDKSKGWVSRSATDHTELACKKVRGHYISGIHFMDFEGKQGISAPFMNLSHRD